MWYNGKNVFILPWEGRINLQPTHDRPLVYLKSYFIPSVDSTRSTSTIPHTQSKLRCELTIFDGFHGYKVNG